MRVHAIALFLALFAALGCKNPGLYRYLSPSDPGSSNEAIPSTQTPYSSRWSWTIAKTPHVIQVAETPPMELVYLINYAASREEISFRVPPFTYIKFIIENRSDTPLKVNLFQSRFSGAGERNFLPVDEKKFQKLYTSAAYSGYDYKAVSTMYTSKHSEFTAGKKPSEMKKTPPGEECIIEPGHSAFQIIPFQKFSEGSRIYTLYLPESLGLEPVEFHYKTIRLQGAPEKLP